MKEIEKQFLLGLGKEIPTEEELEQKLTWKELYQRANLHMQNEYRYNKFPIHIIDNIYLGSYLDRWDYINDRRWIVVSMINSNGQYNFPIDDFGFDKEYPVNFLKAIDILLELSSTDKNIYVHCASGGNRSVSAILGYIIKKYKLPLDQAINYFKHKRMINPCPKHLVTICLYARIEIPIDFILDFSSNYGWEKHYATIRPEFPILNQDNFKEFIYKVVEQEYEPWMK